LVFSPSFKLGDIEPKWGYFLDVQGPTRAEISLISAELVDDLAPLREETESASYFEERRRLPTSTTPRPENMRATPSAVNQSVD
jgi:hypothetical protein